MAYELWSQDIFSKGELSPFMYARATVTEYGNGLKIAQNVLTYPTGAAGKRFGTFYQSTLAGITDFSELFFQTFQYINECVYQLVFSPLNIAIYLEGILVKNVTTTFDARTVYNLNYTTLTGRFRVSGEGFKPYDLTRYANSPLLITGYGGVYLQALAASFNVGQPLPVRFTTSGTLPTTSPQIKVGITYFVNGLSATTVSIYTTAYNAKFNIDPYDVSDAGTPGANNIVPQNNWTFANPNFKNLPSFDFNGETTPYVALTFTPSAVSGNAVTITVSGAGYAPLIVPSAMASGYVGGVFIGGGGKARITAVASATSFTVSVDTPFDAAAAILGSLVFLAEPAWSDARGWPQICSSYQNRALFANTVSLPNGFWGSATNDYFDFNDLSNDDDDAISWYPTSNDMNYIRFIVPYRSITVHTNTGIYSSPLSDVAAITPTNFTLQLQDSTPADVLLPQAIDNQVLVLSGDDAHQMLWDGINNAYTSDIVSVISEQVIRDPVDETPFADLHRAGSRYVFIINANGTMAVFQTLLSQGVSGFTPQILEQSYGESGFLQSASSSDGRAWFVTQRELATARPALVITGFTATELLATYSINPNNRDFNAHAIPTAITFTTTGSLPVSSPQIEVGVYYWAVTNDALTGFSVYADQADAYTAISGVDDAPSPITFTALGSLSNVIPWPLVSNFILEELTQETFLDCAVYYNDIATDTVPTGALFNAQTVKMVGDDYGFEAIGINNEVEFVAHGIDTEVSVAYIGYPIHTIIEPMPLSLANGPSAKNTTLTKPKHIRTIRFMFNNTIGGTINGVPIALEGFNQVQIGVPPFPARGIFEMSVMKGWDDFNNPTYTIEHSDPFDIQLLGVFYSVDI